MGFELEQDLFIEPDSEIDFKSHIFLFNVVANDLENLVANNLTLEKNVYKLAEVIIYLLRNYQHVNVYNKRQFYLLAREFTGLSAKEITKSLNVIKGVFKESHKSIR